MVDMTRALIALTSHSKLGDTGRETGYYVGEAAEPWEVFRAAGYDVDLVSVAGGQPPMKGIPDVNGLHVQSWHCCQVDRVRVPSTPYGYYRAMMSTATVKPWRSAAWMNPHAAAWNIGDET